MRSAERSFVYGFSFAHCAKAIAMFTPLAVLDTWLALTLPAVWAKVVTGVVAAFFAWMIVLLIAAIRQRKQGARRIVLGTRTLSAPTDIRRSSPVAEIRYIDIRDVSATGGRNGALTVKHTGGTLVVPNVMLANDHEIRELRGLIEARRS